MGDERIRTLGDVWRHPIGNVIAAPDTEWRPRRPTIRGVATAPAYSSTDLRSHFDQCAATGFPEQHGHAQRLLEYRLALVRSLARPRPTDVVLDLGCGNGHHLLALGPEVARGVGIDISPGMIELARAGLRRLPGGGNLSFAVDDAEKLTGIADRSIDLAICIGAFEHMIDKRAVLASIYRVLKFGGRFVCLTLTLITSGTGRLRRCWGLRPNIYPAIACLVATSSSCCLIRWGFAAFGLLPGRSSRGETCRPPLHRCSPCLM